MAEQMAGIPPELRAQVEGALASGGTQMITLHGPDGSSMTVTVEMATLNMLTSIDQNLAAIRDAMLAQNELLRSTVERFTPRSMFGRGPKPATGGNDG